MCWLRCQFQSHIYTLAWTIPALHEDKSMYENVGSGIRDVGAKRIETERDPIDAKLASLWNQIKWLIFHHPGKKRWYLYEKMACHFAMTGQEGKCPNFWLVSQLPRYKMFFPLFPFILAFRSISAFNLVYQIEQPLVQNLISRAWKWSQSLQLHGRAFSSSMLALETATKICIQFLGIAKRTSQEMAKAETEMEMGGVLTQMWGDALERSITIAMLGSWKTKFQSTKNNPNCSI